jgi:hypothetical protein
MSAASDRLAAITAASFANGLHRTAFPAVCNDTATVAGEIAADKAATSADAVATAADAVATAADRVQTGLDRAATALDRTATAALVPLAADRLVGRDLADTAIWPMVRATPAWGIGPTGDLVETPVDTVRWEFDPVSLAPLGVAFAPSRTNVNANPRCEGAVAGTPGTRPTGWGSIPSAAPSVECLGPMTRRGVPGVGYRFSGVPTGTAAQVWTLNTAAITSGQRVAVSVFLELLAGSTTNCTSFLIRADGALSGASAPLGAFQRIGTAQVVSASSSALQLRWNYLDTVTPVDFTIFIGAPQHEINVPFVSAPILPPVGTPGASTRAQGTVDIPVRLLGARYNRRAGTIIVDWNSQPGAFTSAADGDFMGLVSLGDTGADEVMGMLINPAHTSVVFRRTVGGVAQTTASINGVTPPAAGQTIRCAFAWDIDAGLMQVAARGVAGTQLTGQTSIPIITHIMPGRFSTSRPLFGQIAGIEIRPAAVFGAPLAALT